MKGILSSRCKCIIALVLAVQAICLCCVSSACTSAQASTSPLTLTDSVKSGLSTDRTAENYSLWLSENYSSGVYTRADWLRDMMLSLELITTDIRPIDREALFKAARDNGIIDETDPGAFMALTRSFAASTVVRAMNYTAKKVSPVADAEKGDDIMTLAYYGYFIPDDDDKLYPDALVTDAEYTVLLEELRRCAALRGKSLLSFGDSIMYGAGTKGHGIAEVVAEKYGMTAVDYSVSGATFGVYTGRVHIADQIKEALKNGDSADLIMINGGTNDAIHVKKGKMTDTFRMKDFDEKTFAGGMEYALALLEKNYTDIPVMYIRAHDMQLPDNKVEESFGEYALKIADKWSVPYVDIYEDTGFDAEDEYICEKYTYYRSELMRADSIHPTALGYAKYYLPLVCEMTAELL